MQAMKEDIERLRLRIQDLKAKLLEIRGYL